MEIIITVGTICCEKMGVSCGCFCIDGYQFCTRTCAERKLWLRAISNVKVKLQNRAPSPTGEELRQYRSAIKEHIKTSKSAFQSQAPMDALLQRHPLRPLNGGYADAKELSQHAFNLPATDLQLRSTAVA